MQNLIKRQTGPGRRAPMEGKTLAEKLAQNEAMLAAAAEEDAARIAAGSAAPEAPAAPAAAATGSAVDPDDTAAIVAAAKAMRDRYAGTPAPAAAAKTCLIVDDSRVIRKVSSKIAISLGYVPVEAENGEEALARCKKSMPDLVLTDWNMPEMDGITFVTKLRSIPTPREPVVVFCTSNGEAKDIHDGIAAGADDYIVKPFDEAALKAKLEKLGRG
ncbi:PleD family two-component system response regulator [Erythrobacter sp. CCH5-A1]|jgi:CheY-like chemotaxis protein|uniref:response regulator n=1 Tax=Erythrobacter sp. CCH5-A1 TaxID=1768792 RepID=UPI000B04A059|nr:response regulator [Erythrobacter sp. CCH5-A1]